LDHYVTAWIKRIKTDFAIKYTYYPEKRQYERFTVWYRTFKGSVPQFFLLLPVFIKTLKPKFQTTMFLKPEDDKNLKMFMFLLGGIAVCLHIYPPIVDVINSCFAETVDIIETIV
jgi:hypothetical protein